MSTSLLFCRNHVFSNNFTFECSLPCHNAVPCIFIPLSHGGRGRARVLVPDAKKRHSNNRKKSWWHRFFFDESGNWLGLKDDAVLDVLEPDDASTDEQLTENQKFELWKKRAEAIVELSEAQEGNSNEEDRMWEDWILDEKKDEVSGISWYEETNGAIGKTANDGTDDEDSGFVSRRRLVKSFRDFILGIDDEDGDLEYDDRVFRYASSKSAKFLAVLIIVPWALDFIVHDYVVMPFLDRYVKRVPLAAEMLDVRRSQKLKIFEALNVEKARYRLEVEIGKSPPLSGEELYTEIRQKAIELRDEWRLENRRAFANIWSDTVFGISLFVLLYCCRSEVALLKFTGYKILNNVTDTGKAFLIILVTDIFLGYHSESGWQTLLEVIVEHYGFEIDQAAITIFVCFIPVVIDACVKLWV
ncbi:hypothetical protein M569_10843, partial [Genlisea aurea]